MKAVTAVLIVTTPECRGREGQREPVTVGVPLPKGLVAEVDRLLLVDDNNQSLPLQAIPTDRWPDGSLRWVLLDFQLIGRAVARREFALTIGADSKVTRADGLIVTEHPKQIRIDTGAARFLLRAGAAFPFAGVVVGGREQRDPSSGRLCVTDPHGRCFVAQIHALAVETRGPLRTVVRVEGTVGPRRRALMVIARVQFFAGSAAVRVAITLRNPRRARHVGGYWELGDRGSVYLQDASLHFSAPFDGESECAPEIDSGVESFSEPLELYQDSSGGDQWQHRNHVNRHGTVPCSFRGYRLVSGARHSEGLRATPAVRLCHPDGSVGIAVEQFWQNCPKAIEIRERTLTYRMFPRQYADLHELQGGEQKSHRFTLMFGGDASVRDDAWFWGRTPSFVTATPSWYCPSEAVPYLMRTSDEAPDGYERLIAAALDGRDSFVNKRERIDEYGWRHFGELYADHENAFSGDPRPIVSHYNNQYDAVAGFATQFFRSGDHRWWELMDDLARHVVDIDIYHTDQDKAAYNHGLFWHTAHYADAGRSTHRSYPRAPKVGGGGPSNEHNYATGLMLHYFLTGEPASRECAVGLAQWAIAMDDGRKTVFRWLARTSTGLASQTSSPQYHGPGRGAGHSLRALLDGHRLTGEAAFLNKAEEIIRRVIHPLDDVAARELLDAERRWSYTAFLQALGAYLDYKAERDQFDEMYAYARNCLLHYARWMAAHEYPYLDKPELLEYPTETWAAQDLRKSDVFYLAALHASDEERPGLLERGAFFFEAAVQRLLSLESRTLTRPIVLALTNGRLHAYLQARPERRATTVGEVAKSIPPSAPFVPQKARAKERLIGIAAILAVAALLPVIGKLLN